MTPTSGRSVFIDTNVLVYASFRALPFHEMARTRLRDLARADVRFWMSRQVIREFLATASRPGAILPQPRTADLLAAVLQFQREFSVADDDSNVTSQLLALIDSRTIHGRQIHDANIAATMIRNSIPFLLTHNVRDFSRYAPEVTVLPLVELGRV